MEGNNNNNNNNHHHDMCQVCGSGYGRCGRCGNMCGFGGHHILRWIIGILIITWVFCIGAKFGEFKSALRNSGVYGYRDTRIMPMMGSAGWNDANDTVYFTQGVPAGATTGTVQVIKK